MPHKTRTIIKAVSQSYYDMTYDVMMVNLLFGGEARLFEGASMDIIVSRISSKVSCSLKG